MKYVKIISLMLFAVFLVGCGRDLNNITSKTSYVMNEKASMDKLEITLTNAKYLDNDIQTIVTTTDIENIDKNVRNKANVYKIENGKIISREII